VKINRWGAAAAFSAVAALALATPAAAEDETTPPNVLAEHDGLTVTQSACADGGQITITATGITYYVSSGMRTAGLAARLGGEIVTQEQVVQEDGEYVADETLVLDAPTEDATLEYRWFAGPRRDDLPAWKATGPADDGWDAVVAAIEALEEAEGRDWDARDTGEFITWFEVKVAGCPSESASDSAADSDADPDADPSPAVTETPAGESPAPGAGAELPTTGVPTWGLAAAGGVLLLAGTGAVLVGRRRRLSLD